jgi:hypothetical protein
MYLEIPLAVAVHSFCRHLRFEDRMLGDAAVRDVDLMYMRIRRPP